MRKRQLDMTPYKLTADQIDKILSALVPVIAEPADHAFMRGVLAISMENMLSADVAAFVERLLDTAGRKGWEAK